MNEAETLPRFTTIEPLATAAPVSFVNCAASTFPVS